MIGKCDGGKDSLIGARGGNEYIGKQMERNR